MTVFKVGDLCKHFKGTNLLEKNIYQIVALNVKYTGDEEGKNLSNLVIYSNIFQENMFFAREYEDLITELSQKQQKDYHQQYRVEVLTTEEKQYISSEIFQQKKKAYIKAKNNNIK